MTSAEREAEKATYAFRRALGDFTWKNCTHSTGESIPDWLSCWRCMENFMAEKMRPRPTPDEGGEG